MYKSKRLRSSTRVLALGVTAALALSAAACGGSSSSSNGGVSRANTLIVGRAWVPIGLDPVHTDQFQGSAPVSLLYDRLVTVNDETSQVEGSLASEFKVANDLKSISITLHSGVKFHDGTPLTAKDVAYTLDRTKALGQGAAAFIAGYESTSVEDDTHLTIHLANPSASFLPGLAMIYVLNSKLVEKNAASDQGQAWLSTHEAGSGPYTLDAARTKPENNQFVLNPDYWADTAGRPKAIVLRFGGDNATLASQLESGSIDVAQELDQSVAQPMSPKYDVKQIPTLSMWVIWMNMTQGPTANPAVRKAVQMAVDYTQGLKVLGRDAGSLFGGVIPATMPCTPSLPEPSQNLDEARKLLAGSGLSNIELSLSYQPAYADAKNWGALLQSNLKEIGIDLKLVPITFPQWIQDLRDPQKIPQMTLVSDAAPFPDTGAYLNTLFLSSNVGSTNRTGFKDTAVDSLLTQANAEPNEETRCGLLKDAQNKIAAQAPGVFLFAIKYASVFSDSRVEADTVKFSSTVGTVDPGVIRLKK